MDELGVERAVHAAERGCGREGGSGGEEGGDGFLVGERGAEVGGQRSDEGVEGGGVAGGCGCGWWWWWWLGEDAGEEVDVGLGEVGEGERDWLRGGEGGGHGCLQGGTRMAGAGAGRVVEVWGFNLLVTGR